MNVESMILRDFQVLYLSLTFHAFRILLLGLDQRVLTSTTNLGTMDQPQTLRERSICQLSHN